MRLGVGQMDNSAGHEVDVHSGDVVVVPAGTGHSCAESTGDFRYIGVYPTVRISWAKLMKPCASPLLTSFIACTAMAERIWGGTN